MDVTVVTVIRKVLETQSDSSHRSAHNDEQRNETSVLNKVSHVIILFDEARVYLFMRVKTSAIERSPKAPLLSEMYFKRGILNTGSEIMHEFCCG
jgi:hypothetical protein